MAQGTTRGVPIDTDPLLAADSDLLVASQKATKAYADTKQTALGFTPENVANKSDSFTASSTTTYANTKALVDGLATKQNTLVLAADYTDVAFTASVAAERLVRVIAIPRGTFIVGRDYKISAFNTKTGTASQTQFRLRIGTSASPSPITAAGAIAATGNLAATINQVPFNRSYLHIQTNSTVIYNGGGAISDSAAATANNATASGFDFANVDYWLILTVEHNTTSADAYISHGLILSI